MKRTKMDLIPPINMDDQWDILDDDWDDNWVADDWDYPYSVEDTE